MTVNRILAIAALIRTTCASSTHDRPMNAGTNMTDPELTLNEQICPPHDFRAGWIDNDHGAIYCRFCGDVRALTPQTIGPSDATPIHRTAEDGGRRGG